MHLEDLVKALENDEFVYFYQPKVSMVTGEICGAEALIRWQKPDGTIIPPFEFIPLSESSGFINEITLSMFNKLIIDMNIFHQVNDSLVISFNASAKDFYNKKFTEKIREAVTTKLITSESLEVELTETADLKEENVGNYLIELREIGIGIAMDDFGTGYSSIDTLSKWPFSCVKIDQGLVGRMEHSEKDFSIVHSSIRMLHKLELEIIAEDIETENVYNILLNAGCSIGQGYWISRPIPIHFFLDFIASGGSWPTSLTGILHMAQLDHMNWRKVVIDNALFLSNRKNKNDQLRGAPVLGPTACLLGKWYYGPGKRFSGTKWYNLLEEPHNQLHQEGAKLLDSAKCGVSKKELMLYMRKFSEISILLIRMLENIENELLISTNRNLSMKMRHLH